MSLDFESSPSSGAQRVLEREIERMMDVREKLREDGEDIDYLK